MLNKERLERWIGALESGEYKQTIGYLREPDAVQADRVLRYRYCAVGVGVQVAWEELGGHVWRGPWCNAPQTYQFFYDWLGVDQSEIPIHDDNGRKGSVTGFNDGGAEFPEIAQRLRKEYL